MWRCAEERGQSIQVGAVLLFGILIIVLAMYQAFVVPSQNEEIEFDHNHQVQEEMTELRATAISMPGVDSTRSSSVRLGVRYPPRSIFVNPGPATGSLATSGTTNQSAVINISNATAVDSTSGVADFWDGETVRTYNTGWLAYEPNYNIYDGAPETVYEHGILFNEFDREATTLPITEQTLIADDRIAITTLTGEYRETRTESVSVDLAPISTNTRTVELTEEGGPITIELPTRMTQAAWDDLLADQALLEEVTVEDGFATLQLESGHDYEFQLSAIGVGTNVDKPTPSYLLEDDVPDRVTIDETESVVVAVRDEFNNPKRGVDVNATVVDDEGTIVNEDDNATTDRDGEATFTYQAPAEQTEAMLRFSFVDDPDAPGFDPDQPEHLEAVVDIVADEDTTSVYDVRFNTSAMAEQSAVGLDNGVVVVDSGEMVDWIVEANAREGGEPLSGVQIELATTNLSTLLGPRSEPNTAEPADTSAVHDGLAGEGTEADPYVITDDHELQSISEDDGAHYVLGRTIDASNTDNWHGGAGFDPVSLDGGSFDGQGYLIEGLTIDRGLASVVGLFDQVDGSSVERVGIVEADVRGDTEVGILAGESRDSRLEEVFTTGTVSGNASVGGLVGDSGHQTDRIRRAYSHADVEGHADASFAFGGLVGLVEDTGLDTPKLRNVYARGSVTAPNADAVGGLIGHSDGGEVRLAYSSGDVTGNDDVGGFMGSNDGSIENSYYDDAASGDAVGDGSDAGVEGLSTDDMQGRTAEENMDGFDFGTIWESVSEDYPALRALGPEPTVGADTILPTGRTNTHGEYVVRFGLADGTDSELLLAAGGDDGDDITITADTPPTQIDVSIDSTNEPVTEGDELDVDVTVHNSGGESGTQDINLTNFDGEVVDTEADLTVDSGDTESITLTWDTEPGDAGTDDIQVDSDDDSATEEVTIQADVVQPSVDTDASAIDPDAVDEGDVEDYNATVELEDLDDVTEDGNVVTVTLHSYNATDGTNVTESTTFDEADIDRTDNTTTVFLAGGDFDGLEAPTGGTYDVIVDVDFQDGDLIDIEDELIDEIDVAADLVQPSVDTADSSIDPDEVDEGADDDYTATVELADLDDVTEDGNEVTVTLVGYDADDGSDVVESATFDEADIDRTDNTTTVVVDGGDFDEVEAPDVGTYDVLVNVTFEDDGLDDIEDEQIDEITVEEPAGLVYVDDSMETAGNANTNVTFELQNEADDEATILEVRVWANETDATVINTDDNNCVQGQDPLLAEVFFQTTPAENFGCANQNPDYDLGEWIDLDHGNNEPATVEGTTTTDGFISEFLDNGGQPDPVEMTGETVHIEILYEIDTERTLSFEDVATGG